MLHLLTQLQKNLQLDHIWVNKYHPEPSENRAIWKSDNQGFKEAKFIQTGRRGGDVDMHREAQSRSVAQRGGRMGGPTFTCGG